MPWNEVSIIEQRREFVALASCEGANISELCRRFGISRDEGLRIIKGLQDKDYGLRAFVFEDPDGNRIDVGQAI